MNQHSKLIKKHVVLLVLLCFNFGSAQLTDLARLEYSFIPSSKSEDQYTRLRLMLNYPIELKKDTYFVVGAEYNRIILNLNEPYPFNNEQLSTLNIIDLNLGYTFKTSEFWRFGFRVTPRIASTLNTKITSDDIFLNGGVFAINDRTDDPTAQKPHRWVYGLTYNTTAGVPIPLPFLNYFRRINPKWSYSVGIPKSNIKRYFGEKSVLQLYSTLDGYFANLQQPITVDGKQANNISLSIAVAGLGYEYNLTKHLIAYMYTGYTFRLRNVLRSDDRDEIFTLTERNAFYLRSGIKFKI